MISPGVGYPRPYHADPTIWAVELGGKGGGGGDMWGSRGFQKGSGSLYNYHMTLIPSWGRSWGLGIPTSCYLSNWFFIAMSSVHVLVTFPWL